MQPKRRARVEDLRGPQAINPVASPVSSFYVPQAEDVQQAPQGANSLMQLGESLRRFSPELSRVLWRARDREVAKQIERGEVLAAKQENMMSFADAEKKGIIPPGANPYLRQGYNRQLMRQQGNAYRQMVTEGILASDLMSNPDPNALNEFLAKTRADFLNNLDSYGFNPSDTEEILLPYIEQTESQVTNKHIEQVSKSYREGLFAGVADNTTTELTSALGLLSEANADKQQVLKNVGVRVKSLIDDAWLHGASADPEKLKTNVVDAVDAMARNAQNPELYNVLDSVSWGPGGTLGGTAYAKGKVATGREAITRALVQEEERQYKLSQRTIKETTQNTMVAAQEVLLTNPGADLEPYLNILKAQGADGEYRQLVQFQRTMQENDANVIEDPEVVMNATIMALRGEAGMDFVTEAVRKGVMKPSTAKEILSKNNSEQDQATSRWATMWNSHANESINATLEVLRPLPMFKKLSPSNQAQIRSSMKREILRKTMEWQESGELPTIEEEAQFLDNLSQRTIKQYDKPLPKPPAPTKPKATAKPKKNPLLQVLRERGLIK